MHMNRNLYRNQRIALLVPCFNEDKAIQSVIRDFRMVMPELDIFVFDNNSTDRTAEVARAEGAEVISVALRGKGNVVRRMFADVDADLYVMVDGDATYHAKSLPKLVDKLIDEHLDMVVGCRHVTTDIADVAYRHGHQWGNKLLTQSVVNIFGGNFTDMLSGYRVFTRRFAKSFPALAHGFETETELTVHALELRMPYGEVLTPYGARLDGSESKLSTYRDGWRILQTVGKLYVSERPLAFFGICAALLAVLSVILVIPIIEVYLEQGVVPRFPTAILAASMMISALLSFCCGLILDNVTRGRHEMKRLAYIAVPSPRAGKKS